VEKKVYVYIHIPKTAGQFIKKLISYYKEKSKIYNPFLNISYFSILIQNHPTIKFVKQQLPAVNSDDVGFFVIVRNPYDRVYSLWKWSKQNGIIGNIEFPTVPNTFEEFVTQLGQGDYNTSYFMQSQLHYIKGEDIDNLKLFKYEDINSIKSFLQSCNVGWSEKKINDISGPSYKDVYTPEMVEIVKTKYRDEFDTFGYSTDL
jgi:hypothetical protein